MHDLLKPLKPTSAPPFVRERGGLCLCLLLSFAASAVGAPVSDVPGLNSPRLGTLFFSQPEREAIVKARFGIVDEESPSIVRLTGIVKRSGGKSTAWINGQAVPEGQSEAPGVKTTISTSSVTVDGQRVRVGEALDTNTRQRADIVSPGAVTSKGRP